MDGAGLWEQVANSPGGTVASLTGLTADDGNVTVFAATPLGLFKSLDTGRSWTEVDADFDEPSVQVVAASPSSATDKVLFAGTRSGLFISVDGGSRWTSRLRGNAMTSVAFSPEYSNDGIVFTGTETSGVLRSEDCGTSWMSVNAGLLELSVYAIALSPAFQVDRSGFLATDNALYRTRNGGRAWREVDTGFDEPSIQCLAISPEFATDRLVIAGTEDDGILLSMDGGTSWNVIETTAGLSVASIIFAGMPDQERALFASSSAGILVSHDSGRTWSSLPESPGMVLSMLAVPDNYQDVLVVGQYRDGIARSDDGGTSWQPSNAGLRASLITDLVALPRVDARSILYAIDLESGVLSSEDEGSHWREDFAGMSESSAVRLAPGEGPHLLFAAATDGVYRRAGSTHEWDRVLSSHEPIIGVATSTINDGEEVAVGAVSTTGAVFISRDTGLTWSDAGRPGRASEAAAIALSPEFVRDGVLYLAFSSLDRTSDERVAHVVRTDDDGANWETLLTCGAAKALSMAVTVDSHSARTVRVGAGNSLYRLPDPANDSGPDDSAPQHPAITVGGPGTVILDLVAMRNGDGPADVMYVATTAGVFCWRDVDETPFLIGGPLRPGSVIALAPEFAISYSSRLYAVELGGDIWKFSESRTEH